MKNLTILSLVAVVYLASGCDDGKGNTTDDGDASEDSVADTTMDTTIDPAADPATDTVSDPGTDPGTDATPPPEGYCPALPAPTGTIINLTTDDAGSLSSRVNDANTGDTILLADGEYDVSGQMLIFSTPGVTMRSASGNREAVILDANYGTGEIVMVAASDVTIADITLREAQWHPIHVVSTDDGPTLDTLIYNVHVIDPGEQAIKINPHAADIHFVDYGEIACSHIEMTDAGRGHVSGCYTGGVDAHQAQGWIIRDNLIEGFWCDSGLSEHGIHLWTGSRDTLIERNVLVDNARGIGLGLGESGATRIYDDDPCTGVGYVGHYGGMIRNNFIYVESSGPFGTEYGFDCGICVEQACGVTIVHNTVISTQPPFSSIEWRWANTSATIQNNLVSHNLVRRNDASPASLGPADGNVESAPLTLFESTSEANLHLLSTATSAIDQGVDLDAGVCDHDIDGDERDSTPDVGADEYTAG